MTTEKTAISAAVHDATHQRVTALDLIARQPWAIEPAMLQTITDIARRENDSPEAVAAKLGRPLQNTRNVRTRDGTAIIPVTGPIFRYANVFTQLSGATSLDILARDFAAADADPDVGHIVLEIDSPGGQASGIAEFAQQVAGAKTPVTAYVDGVAASAAYWLATPAGELVLSKTSEVGAVGAVLSVYRGKDKNTIEFVSNQSPMKRADPESDAGRAELQRRVDALAQVFIDDVAAFRRVDVEAVLTSFGRGGVRMGQDAVDLGMADRVSTLENVINTGFSGQLGGHKMADVKTAKPAADKPAITLAIVKAEHTDIAEALKAEGYTEGMAAGIEQETARIKSVQDVCLPGHEALIQALMFDGTTTANQAAIQVIKAETESRGKMAAAIKSDAPAPLPGIGDEEPAQGKADFWAMVEKRTAAGETKGAAIRAVADEHPEAHRAWLDRVKTARG